MRRGQTQRLRKKRRKGPKRGQKAERGRRGKGSERGRRTRGEKQNLTKVEASVAISS